MNDKIEGVIGDISMILAGVASSAMLGFSPTIYASAKRTYTTMIFCIVVVSIHIFCNNVSYIKEMKKCNFRYIMYTIILLGYLDLIMLA